MICQLLRYRSWYIKQSVASLVLCLALVSLLQCGGGSGTGVGATTSINSTATSQICENVSGLEAVFWDYVNGIPRGDLPSTAFTIPTYFTVQYAHPTVLSFFFYHPADWTSETIADQFGLYGVNLKRNDDQALWRSVNGTITSNSTAKELLNNEINSMLDFVGNPADTQTLCTVDATEANFAGGLTQVASVFMRAGDFTANISVNVIGVPLGGGSQTSSIVVNHTIAPTSEYASLIQNVFIPIHTQFYGGSSSSTFACSDGLDNDGDGQIDFPADPECTSANDDSESTN